MQLEDVIDLRSYPILEADFQAQCRATLEETGAVVLPGFLTENALVSIRDEGNSKRELAYFAGQDHNVYISDPDPNFGADHVRNRTVVSSKGCITDDQIDSSSALRTMYDSDDFRQFLCAVLGEDALYPYADPWSSINLHYAGQGQELGWHFDNSSFATTLLIQKPEGGGVFEYVRDMRDADIGKRNMGEMNFAGVERVLNGEIVPSQLAAEPGALALFRGRNAIHRVTPTEGPVTRMLVVLAYNNQPGITLSASARKTFYGK